MTENNECTEDTCCKSSCSEEVQKLEARKQEEKALIADAVAGCCKSVDPLALVAQLSLTVVQLQKDQSDFEKSVGKHFAELINHFNTQLGQIMQSLNAPKGQPMAPGSLRAVPPQQPQAPVS